MIFNFSQYQINVDIERTREFYAKPQLTKPCTCDGCENFQKAADNLPEEITSFFRNLGIDITKPAEVYIYHAAADSSAIHYGGWYHACGEMHLHEESQTFHKITDTFSVLFHDSCYVIGDDFPRPAIQLEIDAYIPWVLDRENHYQKTEETGE